MSKPASPPRIRIVVTPLELAVALGLLGRHCLVG